MMDFAALLQQGAGNAWLFIPSAILLGALHGLEPGHSKTMMAAFIIAVQGTVKQAVLLGLAATVSHTLVVWAIALGGMMLSRQFDAATTEPWFQLASGVIIVTTALWMFWRSWREERDWQKGHHHGHDHHHSHDHDHHHHHPHPAAGPRLSAGTLALPRIDLRTEEYQDAHARAHASDIERRFANRKVTTGQIVLFGLTGGLIPCPAAITVLLLCIQMKALSLGALLVLCFSIGLALTLVTVGVAAALSMRQAAKRWRGLSALAKRAPWVSSALIAVVGIYMGIHGWLGIVGR